MQDVNIEIQDYEYHRNGVGGQPFWVFAFTMDEGGRSYDLYAIVGASNTLNDEYDLPHFKVWRIIEPTNIHSNWRGDRIGEKMRDDAIDLLRNKA